MEAGGDEGFLPGRIAMDMLVRECKQKSEDVVGARASQICARKNVDVGKQQRCEYFEALLSVGKDGGSNAKKRKH